MKTKVCSQCKAEKPLNAFSVGNKGALNAWCKVCAAKKQKAHYAKNAEKINLRRAARLLIKRGSEQGVDIKISFDGEDL